jgi:endonuclease/exonuclease/phosphatase (EEP) superfamily protein YafD
VGIFGRTLRAPPIEQEPIMRQDKDHEVSSYETALMIVSQLSAFVAASTGLLTLAAFGSRWNWLCELTAHWPVQIVVGSVVACFVLLLSKRWKLALLAGSVALVNASYVVPLFLPGQHGPVAEPICQVVSANVHTSNHDASRFAEFIRTEDPDFFLVMEVNKQWKRALGDFDDDYPYSVIRARSDNFGIALLSRHPILEQRVESFDDSGIPTIIAKIDFHGQSLNVVGTHPLPPIGRRRSELNHQHLHALGDVVARLSRPVILLGDLNTTSWSPHFQTLLQHGDLKDSRQGFGIQATWPNEPQVLRIPIDHALVSRDLTVTQRNVGTDIGSDHFPIVLSFGKKSR